MGGRPPVVAGQGTDAQGNARSNAGLPRLRLEILQELQLLIENRDARDRIDRGPLAETKGREHWVLHLLLRAEESAQAHTDRLIGSSYANLTARIQAIEDHLSALSEAEASGRADLGGRVDGFGGRIAERMDRGFAEGTERVAEIASARLSKELTEKWKPIGETLETFSHGTKEMIREVSDTYKVATQTRLLLNENARRISDLGKDLLSLEEGLRLVVQRAIEEGFAPLEQRLAQVEARLGIPPPANGPTTPTEEVAPELPSEPRPEPPSTGT